MASVAGRWWGTCLAEPRWFVRVPVYTFCLQTKSNRNKSGAEANRAGPTLQSGKQAGGRPQSWAGGLAAGATRWALRSGDAWEVGSRLRSILAPAHPERVDLGT